MSKHIVGKFPLDVTSVQTIKVKKGARFLHVDVQHGRPCTWWVIDLDEPETEEVTLHFRGTGHPMHEKEAKWPHLGTVILEGGALVFHLFLEEAS